MKFLRKLEIGFGIATLVLALIVSVINFGPLYNVDIPLQLLGAVVFFIAPALMVALGGYLHAMQRKSSGFNMLWLGGLFLTVMLFVHALGGVFYLYGLWRGLEILTPSVDAIASMIASLLVRLYSIKE